jgi:hypothetical protein
MTVSAKIMFDEMPPKSRERIEARAAALIVEQRNSSDLCAAGLRPDEAPPPDRPRNTT